jgi:hypothetical protein
MLPSYRPVIVVLVFLRFGREGVRPGRHLLPWRGTGVRGPGLIIPHAIFERMTRVTLRTITMNILRRKSSPRTTSPSTLPRSYYHIVDPEEIGDRHRGVNAAINQISQTTVRNVVGNSAWISPFTDGGDQRED